MTEIISNPVLCEVDVIHPDHILHARASLIDGQKAADLANTFQALSDPTRVRIVSMLESQEMCVCDLAALLGMSQSAISHQLRTLRDLRLVRSRREGREIIYTLDDDHIRTLYRLALDHIEHQSKHNINTNLTNEDQGR
jgi:ArsR family transcriptional regulator, lead/cadmium/zinc/bismuth-responsive transcriptional repressor